MCQSCRPSCLALLAFHFYASLFQLLQHSNTNTSNTANTNTNTHTHQNKNKNNNNNKLTTTTTTTSQPRQQQRSTTTSQQRQQQGQQQQRSTTTKVNNNNSKSHLFAPAGQVYASTWKGMGATLQECFPPQHIPPWRPLRLDRSSWLSACHLCTLCFFNRRHPCVVLISYPSHLHACSFLPFRTPLYPFPPPPAHPPQSFHAVGHANGSSTLTLVRMQFSWWDMTKKIPYCIHSDPIPEPAILSALHRCWAENSNSIF